VLARVAEKGRAWLSVLLRSAISAAWATVPAGSHPVVYAGHQLDVNGIAVLRALGGWGYPDPVLLVHDVASVRQRLAQSSGDDFSAVEIRHVRSVLGLVALVRGPVLLFTSFLYGGPRPRAGRFVVNLWHGDGPKSPVPEGEEQHRPASHVILSNNKEWGRVNAEAFGLSADRLWVTGNPRVDEMLHPSDDAALRQLGLDPAVPIVLWAPTFRTAEFAGVRVWSDSAAPDPFDDVLRSGGDFLRRMGCDGRLQIVVKPHPFDATDYRTSGLPVITDDDLAAAGINLYRFMARCAGLMTDYSSIWTDYAALDRPIILYCPDVQGYTSGRGFAGIPFRDVAPGPLAETPDELRAALEQVAGHGDVGRELRSAACERLGVERRFGATDRLMQRLSPHVPPTGHRRVPGLP
jgi:CDP-glycerol glycerophosphotransferase